MTENVGLVVDDEESISGLIKKYFSKSGIPIVTAKNGIEAKEILGSQKIGFIITDIVMPKMNGNDLVEFIQQDYPQIPIFIITGDCGCIDAKIKNFPCLKGTFLKPFDLNEMRSTIIEVFESQ